MRIETKLEIISQYVSEKASYGRCSAYWRKARKKRQRKDEARDPRLAGKSLGANPC